MRILIMLIARADSGAGSVSDHDGLIEAYYLFSDAGVEIVLAAPGGGSASEPIRPEFHFDDTVETRALRQRYIADRKARDCMNDLVCLSDVCAEDFDAALCLSPQVFDSSAKEKDRATVLVNQLLASAKPVAVMGEPPGCTTSEPGNGLLLIGHSRGALRLAANALLGAVIHR